MDDIIVIIWNSENHLKDSEKLFFPLRNYGLNISKEKSHLLKPEVVFMGYIISASGVKANPEKVSVVW